MLYVGIDLHKHSISICVMNQSREIITRKKLACNNQAAIVEFFQTLPTFRAVVEATASYEWFVKLIEPLTDKLVLAHPKKLRVIAESTRKSDKLDAQVLAEFLVLDMIPAAYRPTQRQQDHRRLVRQRDSIQRRITSVKNRIRRLLSHYNADRKDLFTHSGLTWLQTFECSSADRFSLGQMLAEYHFQRGQLKEAEAQLKTFATTSPIREREQRRLLESIPGVGFITVEVVLAEVADITRFGSQKQVVAYAGLAPGQRESAGKSKDLHIEKTGSSHLRWILVEAAWRLVRYSPRWAGIYERLKVRLRGKKAIVAIARRLLCLMTAILKTGQPYDPIYSPA